MDKNRERLFAEILTSELGGDPPWRIVEDGEAPDFALKRGAERIGLEITELYRLEGSYRNGSRRRMRENLYERVTNAAEAMWIRQGLPAVIACTSFTGAGDFGKKDVIGIAGSLVQLARDRLPPIGGEVTLRYDWHEEPRFPREVRNLYVQRFPEIDEASWLHSDSGWMEPLRAEMLQEWIDHKEPKRRRYQISNRRVWLLVGCDGFALSGSFSKIELALQQTYKSSFERVFLAERFRKRVWPVRVAIDD